MNKTNIPYLDFTWNPVTGCGPDQISPGCKNCWARKVAETRLRGRAGYDQDDPFKVTFHRDRMTQPRYRRKPARIGGCFMGDVCHPDVPDPYLRRVMSEAYFSPQHTFFFLTKRPARFLEGFPVGVWHENTWLGVTVCNQAEADDKIPILLSIPAAHHWLSIEPMLNYMNITPYLDRLSWVVCGGESGPSARPANPFWFREIRDECADAGVKYFMKQMSGREPIPSDLMVKEVPE